MSRPVELLLSVELVPVLVNAPLIVKLLEPEKMLVTKPFVLKLLARDRPVAVWSWVLLSVTVPVEKAAELVMVMMPKALPPRLVPPV